MARTQVNINVPGNHLMVGLLGQRDELLRLVEAAFPGADIHVRGNEITVDGDDAEQVGRLFEELVLLLQQGQPLDAAERARARSTWCRPTSARPRCSPTEVLRGAEGPHGAAEDERPEALRRRHPRERHHLRHRPGRHRQELAGRGHGGAGAAGQAGRSASSSPARRSRPASGSASCPAT